MAGTGIYCAGRNAAQEDVLCQITIPQIYDGGNYGIVSSVYQGTPANVTLEYRDNGTVEAEAAAPEVFETE